MGLYKGITMKMLLIFVSMIIIIINSEVEGSKSISKDEKMELEKQLKILNKPPIKTIHTKWGDIVDCIDIQKQPVFDHPSLKDHIIQIKPSFSPESETEETSSNINLPDIECPEGTVPIRRTQKKDLIRAKSLSIRTNHSDIPDPSSNIAQFPDQHVAYLKLEIEGQKFHGAKAFISGYNPTVAADQFSGAQIWIADYPLDNIQAGWIVHPQLYNDKLTRFFTYWTGDNYNRTGCYNNLCSGFVQTDKSVYLGFPIPEVSTYGQEQYPFYILIHQDQDTGNWWLRIEKHSVGYWPKEIFTNLGQGAESIYWGGHVKEGANGESPQMGSGYLPDDNPRNCCHFTQMKFLNEKREVKDIRDRSLGMYVDCELYGLDYFGFVPGMRNSFSYGGPGGKCPK